MIFASNTLSLKIEDTKNLKIYKKKRYNPTMLLGAKFVNLQIW